jgi:hypothetical protein
MAVSTSVKSDFESDLRNTCRLLSSSDALSCAGSADGSAFSYWMLFAGAASAVEAGEAAKEATRG